VPQTDAAAVAVGTGVGVECEPIAVMGVPELPLQAASEASSAKANIARLSCVVLNTGNSPSLGKGARERT
jgi:hypothetical protein